MTDIEKADAKYEEEQKGSPIQIKTIQSQTFSWAGIAAEVRVSGGWKSVIRDCYGYLNPGESLCIMGPSGAGKTSFLDTLTMRKTLGRYQHDIRMGGVPLDDKHYREITGYVTSDDVQVPEMSVYETLCFAARLRLPKDTTAEQREAKINEVLKTMKIEKCRDQKVGSMLVRGLSTGERKRLNVAIELLTEPTLFFLDEPTTGLDSTTGRELVEEINQLAKRRGMIVIMTIHQPSYQIVQAFDKLQLIGKGDLAFFGQVEGARRYFEAAGHKIGFNPAETYLDVLATQPTGVVEQWRKSDVARELRKKVCDIHGSDARDWKNLPRHLGKRNEVLGVTHASFATQWIQLAERMVKRYVRVPTMGLARLFFGITMGLFLGAVFWDRGFGTRYAETIHLMVYSMGNLPLLLAAPAVPLWIHSRTLYYQEVMAGFYHPFAYLTSFWVIEYLAVVSCQLILSFIAWGMADIGTAWGTLIWATILEVATAVTFTLFNANVSPSVPGAISLSAVGFLFNLLFGAYIVVDQQWEDQCGSFCTDFLYWFSLMRSYNIPMWKAVFFNRTVECTPDEEITICTQALVAQGLNMTTTEVTAMGAAFNPFLSYDETADLVNQTNFVVASNNSIFAAETAAQLNTTITYQFGFITALNGAMDVANNTVNAHSGLNWPEPGGYENGTTNAAQVQALGVLNQVFAPECPDSDPTCANTCPTNVLPETVSCLYPNGTVFFNNYVKATDYKEDYVYALVQLLLTVSFFSFVVVMQRKLRWSRR
eukprot:Clim_evm35s22 gene=Clim_evmTU35s22